MPEVQSLVILTSQTLKMYECENCERSERSAGYLFLIKLCSPWLCANVIPELAHSGVDNYDSMIRCVCVRVCGHQMQKGSSVEKRLCKRFPKYDDL